MPPVQGRGLTQGADNVFMHLDGQNRPVTVVAVIHRQSSAGRPAPPGCQSAFVTAGTPFDKGHVISLDLGGADVPANIVPQYGKWQGIGPWRLMETAIGAGGSEAVIARMTYAAAADTYDTQLAEFTGGNKLFHWTDARIPTRFQVWTTTLAAIQAYLDADGDGKSAAIDLLVTSHGVETYNHLIVAMPEIDRSYWRQQMTVRATKAIYDAYRIAQNTLRQNALFAAAPPPGYGPAPRTTRKQRASLGLPPEPVGYSSWVQVAANRQTVATALANNTNQASVGWSDPERQAVTAHSVDQAIAAPA